MTEPRLTVAPEVPRISQWERFSHLLPWLAFSLGLAATYLAWHGSTHETELEARNYFDFRVRDVLDRTEQRLAIYQEVLRGAQGLFKASVSIERAEFKAYVAALKLADDFPGIQGVGFSLAITPAAKERHIAAIRREGFPEYTIRPEGKRDLYTSIIYLEPFAERNLRAFGYDMYSEPVRRAAMEQARDTGQAAISGKVVLVQEAGQNIQSGFLMYLPVYRNDMPRDTLAQRRASLVGWVYAPFRIADFMRGIYGERAPDLDVHIYDGNAISEQALMYDSSHFSSGENLAKPRYSITKQLELNGHLWTMLITSHASFESRISTERPKLIAAAGITVSLLLTLMMWLLVHGRRRALQFAQQMNQNLIASEQALLDGKIILQSILDNAPYMIWLKDPQGRVVSANQSFLESTGHTEMSEVLGKTDAELWPEQLASKYRADDEEVIASHQKRMMEEQALDKGRLIWTETFKTPVYDTSGKLLGVTGFARDITERKLDEMKVRHQAHYDALTELPNRILFSDRLQQALARARRSKERMAVLFIDLDQFKPVNDTFGHDIGDLLLKEVGQRLRACIRESDTAARIGGDEFCVLLPQIESEQDAAVVGEKILHALRQPYELRTLHISIASSIGISIYPRDGRDEQALIKNADIAMYWAKESGRNNLKFFRADMRGNGASDFEQDD